MKMGTSYLLVVIALSVTVLLTFLTSTVDAAPSPQLSIEKRDWIDEGLDEFYKAIGERKSVSVSVLGDYGVRFGESYTPEERQNFVIGLVALCVAVLALIGCFCRCTIRCD